MLEIPTAEEVEDLRKRAQQLEEGLDDVLESVRLNHHDANAWRNPKYLRPLKEATRALRDALTIKRAERLLTVITDRRDGFYTTNEYSGYGGTSERVESYNFEDVDHPITLGRFPGRLRCAAYCRLKKLIKQSTDPEFREHYRPLLKDARRFKSDNLPQNVRREAITFYKRKG